MTTRATDRRLQGNRLRARPQGVRGGARGTDARAGGADADREVELADREFLSKGITTVHDAGASFETIDRYKRFAEGGKLGVRLYVMIEERQRDGS